MKLDKAAIDYLRKIEIPNRAFHWNDKTLPQLLSMSVKRTPDITSGKYYETKDLRKKRLKRWLDEKLKEPDRQGGGEDEE
jgi:hypothetical protein